MSQNEHNAQSSIAPDDAEAHGDSAPETGTFETTPIDPVISEPPTDTSMIPVVRPSEGPPRRTRAS